MSFQHQLDYGYTLVNQKFFRVHSANREPIMVKNQALEEVNTFTYLGSVVDEVGGTEADVKARISKARFAFISLGKVWKDRTISTKTKCRLFSSNVKSVLLYGCETWKLTKNASKQTPNLC